MIFFSYLKLVEQFFGVVHDCNCAFSKVAEDTNQHVCSVRTCEKMVIEGCVWEPGRTFKYDACFPLFLWMVHSVMRYVPNQTVVDFFLRDFFCVTTGDDFLHKDAVVFEVVFIFL